MRANIARYYEEIFYNIALDANIENPTVECLVNKGLNRVKGYISCKTKNKFKQLIHLTKKLNVIIMNDSITIDKSGIKIYEDFPIVYYIHFEFKQSHTTQEQWIPGYESLLNLST